MKFDPKVFTVLQNFQTINPQLSIFPGNIIKTCSQNRTIFAKAKVPTTFPREFGISDLSRFLSLTSLLKDADYEFTDTHLIIKSGHTTLRYVYADMELMIRPKQDFKLPSVDIEFELKADVLSSVMKAMNIMKYENIYIRGVDGELLITTEHQKLKNSSEVFSVSIGETDKTFTAVIEADKLKILNMNYLVQISNSGGAMFVGEDIEYGIALGEKSKF